MRERADNYFILNGEYLKNKKEKKKKMKTEPWISLFWQNFLEMGVKNHPLTEYWLGEKAIAVLKHKPVSLHFLKISKTEKN